MRQIWIHDAALFGRVLLGAVLGYSVGWEREVRGHPAGARTFALVCAGSAAFATLANDAYPATAEKLIAGIVTGIGFLGVGLVIRDPAGHVSGLTTASAIWAVAAVGVIAGAGRFALAVAVAVLYLVILEGRQIPLLKRLDPSRWANRFASESDTDASARDLAGVDEAGP